MSIISGARLGPYEIISPLGSGGMGDVYRTRDTKLNREVAIKVISPDGRRTVMPILNPEKGNSSLWIIDLDSGRRRRLTLDDGDLVSKSLRSESGLSESGLRLPYLR